MNPFKTMDMKMVAPEIPGYNYGSPSVAKSPITTKSWIVKGKRRIIAATASLIPRFELFKCRGIHNRRTRRGITSATVHNRNVRSLRAPPERHRAT
jgi:hypothetical protein